MYLFQKHAHMRNRMNWSVLNVATGYGQHLGVVGALRQRLLLEDGPQHRRNGHVYACAQRTAIVVDQHQIVAVELRLLEPLLLLEAHQDALFHLALDGHQHLVADEPDAAFVVDVYAPGRPSLGHGTFAQIAVVHHAQPGKFPYLAACRRRVQLTLANGAGDGGCQRAVCVAFGQQRHIAGSGHVSQQDLGHLPECF